MTGQMTFDDLVEKPRPKKLRVLVACEESQEVCKAFRANGHEAYSCDIQECSGGHPEWHIQGDVLPLLNGDCTFTTRGGQTVRIDGKWDLIIAHPPCTYLTVTGNAWFDVTRYGDAAKNRYKNRYKAIVFFMYFALANCDRICIENPVGIMGTAWHSSDQVIQPWQFGHPTVKKTCLWLKGLPPLTPTDIVEVDKSDVYAYVAKNGRIKHDSRNRSRFHGEDRSKHRSRTFPGIGKAMADQWGGVV